MSSFFRIIHFAFQHFFRNFWLSLITISLLTLTLLSVNILLLLNIAGDAAIKAVEKRVDISVTFKTDTTESIINQAAGYLRSFSQTRDVEVITPEEALAAFKIVHTNDQAVLDSLEEVEGNPFGYELVIKANSSGDFPMLLEALDNPSFRDQIESKNFADHEAVLARLSEMANKIRIFGGLVVGLFLLIAVLIAFNTVRVTIFVHREEIAIMRLVGASGRFVRAPYILEAIFFSLLSTAIAIAIVLPAALALDPAFGSYFEEPSRLSSLFVNQAPLIFGLEFLGVVLVTIGSTSFAMRRYLKI